MTAPEIARLAIVAPVFNDWQSVNRLLLELERTSTNLPALTVYLVDDGSTDSVLPPNFPEGNTNFRRTPKFEVFAIRAGANMGHQRAIALGLAEVDRRLPQAWVVVMDADGEDDPHDIQKLIHAAISMDAPYAEVVVAERRDRNEKTSFKALYILYKVLFRILTGRTLNFGNFSLLSPAARSRLLYMPELWNHFPASIMRSKLPAARVPLDRGHRYHGASRMNLSSLVNHGLSAISVFTDVVFTRLLVLVLGLSGIVFIIGGVVVAVRAVSSLAVPGWATTAFGFVVLALLQFVGLLVVMTFIQLSTRSTIPRPPRVASSEYVSDVYRLVK